MLCAVVASNPENSRKVEVIAIVEGEWGGVFNRLGKILEEMTDLLPQSPEGDGDVCSTRFSMKNPDTWIFDKVHFNVLPVPMPYSYDLLSDLIHKGFCRLK